MSTQSPVRERILESAIRLFDEFSLRSVSADKVIADARTTKVTFYRHFPTKDALVVAYLEAHLARLQAAFDAERLDHADACALLVLLARANGAAACRPGFRGCIFINASAEFPAEGSPVREAVERYRRWLHGIVVGLLDELGVTDPAAVAHQLIMLRDGAMVHGFMEDPSAVAGSLISAGRAIIAAHPTIASAAHGGTTARGL